MIVVRFVAALEESFVRQEPQIGRSLVLIAALNDDDGARPSVEGRICSQTEQRTIDSANSAQSQ
jgi:hypothetical protein